MRRGRTLLLALGGVAGLLTALRLAPSSSDVALLAFVLFLAALALARAVDALSRLLPPEPDIERFLRREPRQPQRLAQIEAIRDLMRGSRRALPELRSTLGPLVREILSAHLARRHGVDLEHDPERARALVGDGRAWEILSAPPALLQGASVPVWSRSELEQLVEELEAL